MDGPDTSNNNELNKNNEIININNDKETNQAVNDNECKEIMEEDRQIILQEKEQEELKKIKAQKEAQIKQLEQKYNDILNNFIIKWEADKSNFEQYFDQYVFPELNNMFNTPCILLYQDKVVLIFKFLCKYLDYIKDQLKNIPIKILFILNNFSASSNCLLFSKNLPNFNNQINFENYEIIEDKIFYNIFKELVPNGEIENYDFDLNNNCIDKYLREYLFNIGFFRNFFIDFLPRKDIPYNNFFFFSNYSFKLLSHCEENFIKKNDYNVILLEVFTKKMDYYIENFNDYLNQNKNLLLNEMKDFLNIYNIYIFGGLAWIFDIKKDNLEVEAENFCFSIYKVFEFFLKHQKLELRIFGIEKFTYIVSFYEATPNKQQYNDIERVLEFTKQNFIKFLVKINIFDLIFGENIHEAIIGRSYHILSFLYKYKCFTTEQISLLWKISQSKYQSIGNDIIILFGKLLPEFSKEDCNNILLTVYNMNYNEVNEITLKLLENFYFSKEKHEALLHILFKYSNELCSKYGLSYTFIDKSRNILVKLLTNPLYKEDFFKCIKSCLFCMDNNYLLNTHLTILNKIINELSEIKKKNENQNNIANETIRNISIMIFSLNEQLSMYNILINHLIKMKRFFIFLVEESLRLGKLINAGNFDFDSLLNLDKLVIKYKEYNNDNIKEDSKMELDSDNLSIEDNSIGYLLPKSKIDVEKYLKITLNEFISYFKNKLLKEKIDLSDDEIITNIFNNFEFSFKENTFGKMINQLLDIILSINELTNNYMDRNVIDVFYKILVENSLLMKEKGIFYHFLKKIIVLQLNNPYLNYIKEKDIEYICLERISSNEIMNLPVPSYEILSLYFKYINQKNYNIIYNNESKIIHIRRLDLLVGFKTILDFHISSKETSQIINSLHLINNIIEVSAKDLIQRKYLLDILFNLLKNNKSKIKNTSTNSIEKTGFRRILRLISTINKVKVRENLYDTNDPNNMLDININNCFFIINNTDIISIKAFKGMSIIEFKEDLINKLVCNDPLQINHLGNFPIPNITNLSQLKSEINKNNLVILYYKSHILKDDFTLADYNIESYDCIKIINRIYVDINELEFKMTDQQLKVGYEQIKLCFGDKYNEEIMKEALYKFKGDAENAITFMAEENNIQSFLHEIEEKKKNEPKKREEIICLEEDKFNLLLDILNEGDNDLNSTIWDLFAEIKFPDIFIINAIKLFDNIMEENNLNKKILILKIINSVIFGDNTFCKNNKLDNDIKNEWISKFVNNDIFIGQILDFLSKLNIDESNQNNCTKIISIIINWFEKIFIKIKENKSNKDTNINESGSNFNIIIDNNNDAEEKQKNKNTDTTDFGFELEESQGNNFIEILAKNNFIHSIYVILGIVLEFIKGKDEKLIIKCIYNILIGYLEIKTNDINTFLEEEKEQKKILKVLISSLESEKAEIRKSSINFFKELMNITKQFKDAENIVDIQSFLLTCYYPELISDEVYSEEFYEIYNFLFNFEKIKPNTIPIDDMIEKFLGNIFDFYLNNQKIDNNPENLEKLKNNLKYNLYILCCLHPLYDDLLEYTIEKNFNENKDIIIALYNCLFKIEKNNNNDNINLLFSDDQLRGNSFSFLTILISLKQKYFNILFPKIIEHHKSIPANKVDLPIGNFFRNFDTQKFIGLKNYGATCYLNSLFQQMFMIPTFYQDLFKFNITEKKENLADSTIYNMQLAFINLKKSCMQYYTPINFIHSFKKAFNGEPISLGTQQDTDEFLSILCDKLEKEAKKYGKENFLENSFKGKITNEIVSLENDHPYYSQTEEPFYRITLDIKGHKNLEDALDAYIQGEILDGDNKYFVEKYNKKISIKKRTTIKKIGNQIIIHLKRFEFNFVTFQNCKLNDYLKFPLKLNFKKWTRAYLRMNEATTNEMNNINIISEEEQENLNEEKMNYELTGILVHSGANLKSGHYYSFIKDQETNKWYKFNDSQITQYDIDKDLEKECFGNIDSSINKYGKGAYLLFYTKKECIDSNKNFEKNIKINENILREVENENINFIKVKTFANDMYHKFIINIINCSLNYLNDEEINNCISINDKDYSILISDEMKQEIKIYEKLISILKGNKENKIDLNDNKFENLPENMEQIYEKCKEEIITKKKENDIKDNSFKNGNISLKSIIKLLYFFTFGTIYQYNDREQNLNELLILLMTILQKYPKYSVFIMKMIEKDINIFVDLLFKYIFIDKEMKRINSTIKNLYQLLFGYIYNFERENYHLITNETFCIFTKDEKGKFRVEKEYKSLFLRIFQKLFCLNIEKCREKYIRDALFLDLFNSIISTYPESCHASSNYLISLISFITNNNLPNFKSEKNPKFIMGNKDSVYYPNALYYISFTNTIMRCVTEGMQSSKKISPYFITNINLNEENPDFSLCPKLPSNWRRILDSQFFFNYIMFCPNNDIAKIFYHLSFNDKETTIYGMRNLNGFFKTDTSYCENNDIYFLRIFEVLSLNDDLKELRIKILYDLTDDANEESSLMKFYFDRKDHFPNITLKGIYILAKIILQNNTAYEIFKKNIKKIEWIKDYYAEAMVNSEDQNGFFYKIIQRDLGKLNDLFQIIDELINKLEI